MDTAYADRPSSSHATDSKCNTAPFSSRDGARRTAPICTLGEAVPSCEDKAEALDKKKEKHARRQGSSDDDDDDDDDDDRLHNAASPPAAANAVVKIHRSGTSFATPLVVATAAIVLGFIDSAEAALGEHGALPEDFVALRPRLRTLSGMERALQRTCAEDGKEPRLGFIYVAPWFFLEMDELSRIGIITNELRRCPE